MKRSGKEPRLLAEVMQAIADLRDNQGSTQKKILEHVTHVLKRTNPRQRNLTVQVRRALKHGVDSGLIRQRSGKFRLGLDPKDYAVFKSFRKFSPLQDCASCRGKGKRRKSKRRKGRKRGARRRHVGDGKQSEVSISDSARSRSHTGTPEPQDKTKRRRKRKGKKRRISKRRRSLGRKSSSQTNASPTPNQSATNVEPPQKRRSDSESSKKGENQDPSNSQNQPSHGHYSHHMMGQDEEDIQCGNPECLCSIKADNSMHGYSSSNFRGPYMG